MIVGVYSRREARALATALIGELWPWPGSTPEFLGAESRVEALLTDYDHRVRPQEGSGLTARQFILCTQTLGQLLTSNGRRHWALSDGEVLLVRDGTTERLERGRPPTSR